MLFNAGARKSFLDNYITARLVSKNVKEMLASGAQVAEHPFTGLDATLQLDCFGEGRCEIKC